MTIWSFAVVDTAISKLIADITTYVYEDYVIKRFHNNNE